MSEELITGAVEDLRRAIQPLAYPQPHWNAGRPAWADSLYDRMRDALTATSAQSGAPMQASKAPARIDVITWFVDVDHSVGVWQDGNNTVHRLRQITETTFTPDHLNLVKAMTRRCEAWASSAHQILGDNPPKVPVLRRPCPLCNELWVYDRDKVRAYALTATTRADDWVAACAACKTVWVTKAEQAVFLKLIGVA